MTRRNTIFPAIDRLFRDAASRGALAALIVTLVVRACLAQSSFPEVRCIHAQKCRNGALPQDREKHSGFGKDGGTIQRLERVPNARRSTGINNGQTRSNGFAPARSQTRRRECIAFPTRAHAMSKPNLRDLSRICQPRPKRARATCRLPTGVLPMWRWRACSRPHRFAWLQTRPVARSPIGSMSPARRRRAHDRSRHHDLPNRRCSAWSGGSGRSVAIGTARPGVVTIIPAGSSARWDIPGTVNVVQLYLPHTTLERVAGEADTPLRAICWSERGIPTPLHPDCS